MNRTEMERNIKWSSEKSIWFVFVSSKTDARTIWPPAMGGTPRSGGHMRVVVGRVENEMNITGK